MYNRCTVYTVVIGSMKRYDNNVALRSIQPWVSRVEQGALRPGTCSADIFQAMRLLSFLHEAISNGRVRFLYTPCSLYWWLRHASNVSLPFTWANPYFKGDHLHTDVRPMFLPTCRVKSMIQPPHVMWRIGSNRGASRALTRMRLSSSHKSCHEQHG
jgi:hypothetical protein